ncbi:MAG TPA: hypothetical protein VF493_23000, partial [Terriglobales bacterium]
MKTFGSALYRGTTALLLIAITAGLGCHSNKPAVTTQPPQPVTTSAKAQPDSPPTSNTQSPSPA